MNKLVIDISHYQNWLTQDHWKQLAEVIDGVIIRTSYGVTIDSMAQTHVDNCVKYGLPYAGYHWVDPTRGRYEQLSVWEKAANLFKPRSMFSDVEQFWTDWDAYMSMDLTEAKRTKFRPGQLCDFYYKFNVLVEEYATVPVGSYSADWFIQEYAPELSKWIYDNNYWEARYLRYYEPATWAAVSKLMPLTLEAVATIAQNRPITRGVGRQFETAFDVKGFPYHIDWNVFTLGGFADMIAPVPVEAKQQEAAHMTSGVNKFSTAPKHIPM
jgi:hypothetical protein